MTQRVFMAVDVSNLFKSCREQFGSEARVDFQVLAQSVVRPDLVVSRTAYIVTNPKQNHTIFAQTLRSLGYEVKERFLRYKKGALKPMHSDWDVGITIDAINTMDQYDTFTLVSGDGDFAMLLEFLKSKGKRTVVMSFDNATSKVLYDIADALYVFGESILYNPRACNVTIG